MTDKIGTIVDLPESWVWTTLGEICLSSQYGWTTSASKQGDLHLLRTTDITQGNINWSLVPFCENNPPDVEKYLLYDGDILISRAGSVGYSYLIRNPKKAVFASYLIRFRPLIEGRYLSFFLKSPNYWKSISEKSIGIALANVNASKLRQIVVPLPPLQEQSRIADKIEALFSFLDAGTESLRKVQAQLKRYRQAVLKYAFEGKLTQEWRKFHRNQNDSGIELLKLINEEKQKNNEPTGFGEKIKDKLPEGWVWAKLDDIIETLSDYHANGSYKTLKSNVVLMDEQDYAIMVRTKNLAKNNFQVALKYVSESAYNFLKKSKLFGGEVIIGKIGNAGKVYWMPNLGRPCSLGMNMFLLRFNTGISSKFVYFQLLSPVLTKDIHSKVKGVGNPTIDKKSLRNLSIVLPSFAEQQAIAEMIDRFFSITDEVEKATSLNMTQIEILRQSILKKAFSGTLVPQDPTDEPAEKLLEQIKAEHFNNRKSKIDNQLELTRYVK